MTESGAGHSVICRVGGNRFALPVAAVREVVAMPPLVPLPGAPPAVRGLANVHGVLVTTVSGSLLLGSRADQPGGGEWLVVLSMRQGHVGIEVDDVEDLHALGESPDLRPLDLPGLIGPLLLADSR